MCSSILTILSEQNDTVQLYGNLRMLILFWQMQYEAFMEERNRKGKTEMLIFE